MGCVTKMARYQIDTYKEGITLISRLEDNSLIARIETDFILGKDIKIPLNTPIISGEGRLGIVNAFNEPEKIEVVSNNKMISYFDGKTYKVGGEEKKFASCNHFDISKIQLPEKFFGTNLFQIYILEDASVFCFEKDAELASIVEHEKSSIENLLEVFPLVIAKRVFDQELIKLAYTYSENGT